MLMVNDPGLRPLSLEIKAGLYTVFVLNLVVGIFLYVLSEKTDQYFAWTIKSPLTAAFFGAGYWATFIPALLATRQRAWANVRPMVPGAFLFSVFTLVATLLHLDRFHLNTPAAWVWIAVYVVVPPGLLYAVFRQLRLPGGDPLRQRPLPAWIRPILVLQALYTFSFFAGLFLLWKPAVSAWPWPLTPLTARVVGSMLLAIGISSILFMKENDSGRIRLLGVTYVLFAALQATALLRFPDEFRGDTPGGWAYLALLFTMLAVGLWIWKDSSRARPL